MRKWLLIQGLVCSICLVSLVVCWRLWQDAQAYTASRLAYLQSTEADVSELVRLRDETDLPHLAAPDDDPLRRLRESLVEAGITESAFGGLQRLGDRPTSNEGFISRRLRLRLNELTPQELGRFFVAWTADGSPWRVVSCRLSEQAGTVESNRFAVSLIIRATILGGSP